MNKQKGSGSCFAEYSGTFGRGRKIGKSMRWWFLFFFVSRDGGERRASPTGGYGQRWTPEYNFFFYRV